MASSPSSSRDATVRLMLYATILLLGIRLLSMALMPFIDTSEPRYAEIARLMAVSGDWITPWFEPGLPFWGKPPLAFWLQALSIDLFGTSEFAIRLPAWLAGVAIAYLTFLLARLYWNRRIAMTAVLVYVSSALTFMMAGAVLTDPFLALGTTLSMTALAYVAREPSRLWSYLFFLGLSIGLLAKGPLAGVLIACPTLAWCALQRDISVLRRLPWVGGIILTAVLTLPWYIAAELKTPGFLQYFLVGEHILRFISPGWKGDLYGSAHKEPLGTIWLFGLQAALPWSLWLLALVPWLTFNARLRARSKAALTDTRIRYLLAWALFPMVFFTLAGNIIWTYVLPGMSAYAILAACALDSFGAQRARGPSPWPARISTALIAVAALAGCVMAVVAPERIKTEKTLLRCADQLTGPQDQIAYLNERPFSARFYSAGTVRLISDADLRKGNIRTSGGAWWVAVPKDRLAEFSGSPVCASKNFALLKEPAFLTKPAS